MFFQILVITVFIITLVITLSVLKKRKPAERNVFICALFALVGTAAFVLMSISGLVILEFAKGGFLGSHKLGLLPSLILDAAAILLFAAGIAISVTGFDAIADISSAENKRKVRNFFIVSLAVPVIVIALIDTGPLYRNINPAGVFQYLVMKKFEFAGLKWGMPEKQAEVICRNLQGDPKTAICGHPVQNILAFYTLNRKLSTINTTYETRTKKDQDEIAAYMRSRYGETSDCRKLPDTWGSYICRWHTADTAIEMIVEDDPMSGERPQPRYSMVFIKYVFAPAYLYNKTAAAYNGF